ncbi:MAG: cellulase family glycosylhydrolase [Clostridia bacterium]|nr:cellulase family glycosylhydrolase [Clostridia bacterium]
MKFMLGANYWGADYGTEMWRHYDGDKIRIELAQLAEYGVQCLRVFPNWRDFQPVERAYACRGMHGEYINAYTGEPVYGDGVDMEQIKNFRDFCRAARENNITLVVSIVTGWMSGRLFVPPVLSGKNLINDPEALMWMKRFIHRFVRELKDEKAIVMWDLGNECNCMGSAENSCDAYNWTAAVVDAIRCEDATRPISSGMHSLVSGMETATQKWLIEHQGELTDMLSTHPYPSPTVGGDVEPYNRMRMTFLPTAQSLYYSGVSGKPAYIQESGTFSETIGSKKMDAQFMQIQILSALVNNLGGYQWWCAWEQSHMSYPPYSWSMIERQLGLFDKDRNPKPVAHTMQKMSQLINKLPTPFPNRQVDGVCVLSREQNRQNVAIASLTFAKQAGFDLDVAYSDNGAIPESELYFMPCITGWQVIYKKTWDVLMERVRSGATLCITYSGGQLTDFPEVVGAESMGVMDRQHHTAQMGEASFEYSGKEILLNPTTAEVIAFNDAGNPAVLKNSFGNGVVYFVNFAPENLAMEQPDGFNNNDYYLIYKLIAKDAIDAKLLQTDNKNLGITINPESESNCIATALNYSDVDIEDDIRICHGWEIKEVLYGDLGHIPACDGAIVRLESCGNQKETNYDYI